MDKSPRTSHIIFKMRKEFPIIYESDDLVKIYEEICKTGINLSSFRSFLSYCYKSDMDKDAWNFLMRNTEHYFCNGYKLTQLTELEELPEIKRLDCRSNDLRKLPNMPKLEILNCSDNLNLRELPEMPKIRKLVCDNCDLKVSGIKHTL